MGEKENIPGADAPLSCAVEFGQVVIRVGVNVLALAEEGRDPFNQYDKARGDWRPYWRITDHAQFAKDVVNELLSENEDGSSMLTDLLDKASEKALDQGSIAVEEAPAPNS